MTNQRARNIERYHVSISPNFVLECRTLQSNVAFLVTIKIEQTRKMAKRKFEEIEMEEFEVEKILAERNGKNSREFRVRWKGYGPK